jgi:hypothetical protein
LEEAFGSQDSRNTGPRPRPSMETHGCWHREREEGEQQGARLLHQA